MLNPVTWGEPDATIAALRAAEISVVAFDVRAEGEGLDIDEHGSRIATETGGHILHDVGLRTHNEGFSDIQNPACSGRGAGTRTPDGAA